MQTMRPFNLPIGWPSGNCTSVRAQVPRVTYETSHTRASGRRAALRLAQLGLRWCRGSRRVTTRPRADSQPRRVRQQRTAPGEALLVTAVWHAPNPAASRQRRDAAAKVLRVRAAAWPSTLLPRDAPRKPSPPPATTGEVARQFERALLGPAGTTGGARAPEQSRCRHRRVTPCPDPYDESR